MATWGKRLPADDVACWEWSAALRPQRGAIYFPYSNTVLLNPHRWANDPVPVRHERYAHETGHAICGAVCLASERSQLAIDLADAQADRAGAEYYMPDAAVEAAIRDDESDVERLAHLWEVGREWMRWRLELFFARRPGRRRWTL